eukprot:CAMPEP_0117521208 /NCGR_PEP_ID=MMETSP0784-20121206/33567_1 /TAXON_ID=39447 /ORGANISM="" /LENGTH=915 /DNA_ID=CAMNT_0005317229 /DNA_START=92 /DNA_END=2836 /DNA_ORIENTATION=-
MELGPGHYSISDATWCAPLSLHPPTGFRGMTKERQWPMKTKTAVEPLSRSEHQKARTAVDNALRCLDPQGRGLLPRTALATTLSKLGLKGTVVETILNSIGPHNSELVQLDEFLDGLYGPCECDGRVGNLGQECVAHSAQEVQHPSRIEALERRVDTLLKTQDFAGLVQRLKTLEERVATNEMRWVRVDARMKRAFPWCEDESSDDAESVPRETEANWSKSDRKSYAEAFEETGGEVALLEMQRFSRAVSQQVMSGELQEHIEAVLPRERRSRSVSPVYQHYGRSFDELFESAERVLASFNAAVELLGERTRATAIISNRPKSKKRARMKAQFKYKDDGDDVAWYRLTDLVRATLEYENIAQMYEGLRSVVKHFGGHLVEFSDRYQRPFDGGYRDLQLVVEHDGHLCELRLNTRAMMQASKSTGRRTRDFWQELERAVLEGSLHKVEAVLCWSKQHAGGDPDEFRSVASKLVATAAGSGHAGVVLALIQSGANADAKDCEGNTPLHRAAERGHECAVWALVDSCGATVRTENNKGESPLLLGFLLLRREPSSEQVARMVTVLAKTGGLEHVRKVRSQVDDLVRTRLYKCVDVVHSARKGNLRKLKAELGTFADPNSRTPDGTSALCAAVRGDHCDAVALLLDFGAVIDAEAMNTARRPGHEHVLSEMLERDALVVIEGLRQRDQAVADNVVQLLENGKPTRRQEVAELVSLTTSSAYAALLVSAGVVIPLVALLSSEMERTQELAAWALEQLVALSDLPAVAQQIVAAGAAPPLAALLDSASGPTQTQAASTLDVLVEDASTAAALVADGAAAALARCASSNDGGLRMRSRRALASIVLHGDDSTQTALVALSVDPAPWLLGTPRASMATAEQRATDVNRRHVKATRSCLSQDPRRRGHRQIRIAARPAEVIEFA